MKFFFSIRKLCRVAYRQSLLDRIGDKGKRFPTCQSCLANSLRSMVHPHNQFAKQAQLWIPYPL